MNLDRRLIKKPRIHDIIVRVLVILRRHLAYLKEHPSINVDAFWTDPTPTASKEETRDDNVPISVKTHVEAIGEALEQLSHVGVAIWKSSRITETEQARNSLYEKPDSYHYELLCRVALETLYPSSPKTLVDQLCKSMVDRYARILYRAPIQEALEKDVRIKPTSPRESTEMQPITHDEASMEQHKLPISQSSPSLALPSIESSAFGRNLSAARKMIGPSPTTIRLDKIYGPPVPNFGADGQAKCKWCFQMISQAMAKEGQWTPLGMYA
ncbi:hypothetical protein HBI56_030320 [Parastagonospora nodorum]|nr:hypothetical protein HBI09_104720 [Parastagonospora nodorum]KAH4943251.1 hypothetical protein HBI79_015760 [Parastagonospora nodorum]KAH5010549.1 hypothetical protein HBI77_088350 [Parastagonospora nodorum]KAH5035252.1 hypothetical protein HBI74_061790 [Parastagonospora nodorum]KAH5084780.1 hypothetical protein HBH95_025180 [Parastagonospora nodorum]